MMEMTLRAKNKTGADVAMLTMTGPHFDINSVLGQFKVLVAPSDADKFEAQIVGLLRPGNTASAKLSGAPRPRLEVAESQEAAG